MGLFDNMLKDDESLFLNPEHLDYDYQPKLVPFRENEQHQMALAIKPLLQNRNGKNLLIYGKPGVGKTVSTKHVLKELQEHEEVIQLYINCWKKETKHKIAIDICHQIGYKFTHNKNTDELMKEIQSRLNKATTILILDEADKIEDPAIIYYFLEDIYKKSIFLITNNKEFLIKLDQRLKSRLNLEEIEFKPYNGSQTRDILKTRKDYAFVSNVFDEEAFEKIVEKTFELNDIRTGLYLLKEAGNIAENKSSKKITAEHTEEAISKLKDYQTKDSSMLDKYEALILEAIKKNPGKTLSEVSRLIPDISYKSCTRRINNLKDANLITKEETVTETGGKSFKLYPLINKKLNDY